ncbi:type II toxin-antitoxin system RelE/ParE family toxin [bacterium]|nr:type II toxin-antitoxin system RelE/ParE family toxin [bacterium]
MIVSFGDKATAALFHGERGKATQRFPADIRRAALRKLDVLNGARELKDLRSPPGNRFEALRGNLAGLHSIRVNDQWRVVFRWVDNDAHDVSVVDYH